MNWRDSIIREGVKLSKAKGGLDVDWAEFADRWRGGYGPSMERVRTGDLPWTNIDTLHRMILDELLDEFRHQLGCLRMRSRTSTRRGTGWIRGRTRRRA